MKNEDVELVHRILAGDETAFVSLVEKYQKQVHALAWRKIGDFHIAEEITQDTFLKVYQKLATLKDPNQFSGWLYVIATRQCLTWLRKKRIETESLEGADTEWIDESAYSRYVAEEHAKTTVETQREVVKKLLAKLKESERTVMTLHYFGEMTVEEISRFLGVSTSAIKLRLHRARQRLKKEEPMIREALSNFQLSPNLTENIMQKVKRTKPAAPSGSKPLMPWVIGASSIALIVLMLGIGNQHLARFQQPYSLDAQSEMAVELMDAPVVLNVEAKPDVRNQLGNETDDPGKGAGTGKEPNQFLSDKGDYMRWNLPEGAKARLSKGSTQYMSFSPDGTQIATASATGVWLYDARTAAGLSLLTDHTTKVDILAFSPDGKYLATGKREKILLWDISSRKLLKSFKGFDKRLVSQRFFEDCKTILCVYHDGTACLWDVTTNVKKEFVHSSYGFLGGTVLTLRGRSVDSGDIYLDKNHNGFFAIGYDNGEIRLEDVATGKHLKTLQGGNNPVFKLIISPDGTLLVAYIPDEPLRLWDVVTGQLLKTFTQTKFGRLITFSNDSKTMVFQAHSGEIEFWDVHTKTPRTALRGKLGTDIPALAFSPDSKTIARVNGDGKIHIWDVNTGDKMSSFSTGHARGLRMLKYSHDKSMLACKSGNKIRFWDSRDLTPLPKQIDIELGLITFAFSRDDDILALTKDFSFRKETQNEFVRESVVDGSLSVWNTHSGDKISDYRIEAHKGELSPGQKRTSYYSSGGTNGVTVFSQNGYMLATPLNNERASFNIVLWEIPDGKLQFWLKGHTNKINALAFTPNGKMLASGSDDGTIRVWDASTGTEMLSLSSDNTLFLVFSVDGKILASKNRDGIIYLWDITTGKQLNSIQGSESGRNVMAISVDNKILASGRSEGTIYLWDIATGNQLSILQGHTGPINSLMFSSDGKTLVSGDNYSAIFIWNLPPY
ncbi:hypothetical protein C6501_15010 [Candidatus Poribacteria bacterium]|nr:MAG: hypothetical protein C6501_15010 [Candidatus Poribacteria bacterium]